MNGRCRRNHSGLTAAELVVSIAILLLLAAIGFPATKGMKRRAEKAQCIGNLKVIQSGLNGYLLEHNVWPQMPSENSEWEESDYFGWWMDLLEPYGVGPQSWLCPSDKILETNEAKKRTERFSSYVPAQFNSHQFSPFRWNQPWVVERGDFHGKGAHVVMPDGSVTTSQSPWGER